MKLFFIFDWPCHNQSDNDANLLQRGLIEKGYQVNVDGCSRRKLQILRWVSLAFRTIRRSNKEDIILCWFDFHAVLCFWISKFLFKKRRILAINILLKKKGTLRNNLTTFLYQRAMNSKFFYCTYTSSYQQIETAQRNSFLLNDTYLIRDQYKTPYSDCGARVFSCGSNGRDWELLFKVAQKMPEVKFTAILPNTLQPFYQSTSNVECIFSATYENYLAELEKCSIVLLPLNTEAPAGLIVLYEGMLKSKLILISDTPATREYIQPQQNGDFIARGDIEDAITKIHYYFDHPEIRKACAEKGQEEVQEKGSLANYISTLDQIIQKINEIK